MSPKIPQCRHIRRPFPPRPLMVPGVPILVVSNPAPATADDKKKITTSFEGTVITWKIPRDTAPAPTVDVAKLSATIRAYGLLHGISAKVTDSAAKKKGATMAEKRAAILRTIGNLTAGNWNADRVESVGDGVLMAAMNEYRITQKKPAQFLDVPSFAKWAVDGAAGNNCTVPQFIARMEANPKIAPIVDRLRLAALSTVAFDSDAFLA